MTENELAASRAAAADLLRQVGAALNATGLDTEAARATALLAEHAATRPSTVVIVGEFNTGKSTLANALCGLDILPTGIVPTTATLNQLRRGTPEQVVIHYRDGRTEQHPLSPHTLRQITARYGDHTDIESVDVVSRAAPDGVILVDTPGVNDINETRAEIVYGTLLAADSVVMVMDAQQPMKRSEITFLRHGSLASSLARTVYVLNHIDRLDAPEQTEKVIHYTRGQISHLYLEVAAELRALGNPTMALDLEALADTVPIYCVSAKRLLAVRMHGSEGDGNGLALTRYFDSFADIAVREQHILNRTIIQLAALSAALRRHVDLQNHLRKAEHDSLASIATAQGDQLETQIKIARSLIQQLDKQGAELARSTSEQIRAVFQDAGRGLESAGPAATLSVQCKELERDVARHVEAVVQDCNSKLQDMSRAAVAAIAMQVKVATSTVTLNVDPDSDSDTVGDYVKRFLAEPQNQMLVLLVGPFVVWSLGWLGVAIATIPFLAGLFGGDHSPASSLDGVKASLNATAEKICHELAAAIQDRVTTLKTVALTPIDELQAGLLAVSRQIDAATSDASPSPTFEGALALSCRTDAFVANWLELTRRDSQKQPPPS